MATFYIQLENKLLQISGELTNENISKALGYVPVSPNVTNELSQRVDNITFDSLKDNPFLQDGSGELNIVDEAGNIIAKIDAEGTHSVDFITGEHRLSDKTDKTYVDEAVKNVKVDLTGYATEEYVNNIDFYNIKDNPIVNNGDGKLLFVDENGYIGLQLEEDGLYVKDVIADGHTLSQKADKSELSNYATKDEVSDLVDMSVVTELQGKVNTLIDTDADKSVRDIAVDVLTETLVSKTATEAYDTLAEMSDWIKSHPEDAAAMNTAIQKNVTDITNLDAAYKAADAKVLTDAQEYTDNINFYTIKDNPIVDGEAGSITFVDETGYIGLKVTEDGIIAKDVVTPEHTLSSKADKSFVEDNYYNKSTVDKKITEAVTGGQVSLDGFATEQWVNEQGFLKEHQDISHLAEKSELPTKTSALTNDSGFITINDVPEVTVPTKVSELENDSKFITIDEVPEVTVPTKTSELTNDSGFITINDVPVLEIPEEYITETELNAKGFLTEHQDISHLASKEWVNNQNYATEQDLQNIDYSSINNAPISEDETGELNITDESGNIGMKVASEAVYAKDFIAGEHKLSEKQDIIIDIEDIRRGASKGDNSGVFVKFNELFAVGTLTTNESDVFNVVKTAMESNTPLLLCDNNYSIILVSYYPLKVGSQIIASGILSQNVYNFTFTSGSNQITVTELKIASLSNIPTTTSQLTNDSGFITINDVDIPTKTSDLINDSGFITINDVPEVEVPTKTSDLTNDSGFITSDGTVAKADQLTTTRFINGVPFNGTTNVNNFVSCSTAAATAAKTVTIDGFRLLSGAQVRVKFTNANTASSPTLNVSNTGAKSIYYNGLYSTSFTNTSFPFDADKIYTFTYNGTYWVLEGDWLNTVTATSTSANYPLILGPSASAGATITSGDKMLYSDSVNSAYYNPSTNVLTAPYLSGISSAAFSTSLLTCSTAAATAAKTISASGFKLTTGVQVRVKFTYANTATSPTLNINSTGAKSMCYNGVTVTSSNFIFTTSDTYEMTYDGTYWVISDMSVDTDLIFLEDESPDFSGVSDKILKFEHGTRISVVFPGTVGVYQPMISITDKTGNSENKFLYYKGSEAQGVVEANKIYTIVLDKSDPDETKWLIEGDHDIKNNSFVQLSAKSGTGLYGTVIGFLTPGCYIYGVIESPITTCTLNQSHVMSLNDGVYSAELWKYGKSGVVIDGCTTENIPQKDRVYKFNYDGTRWYVDVDDSSSAPGKNNSDLPYVVCTTEANTAEKAITYVRSVLIPGEEINIVFPKGNTATGNIRISINGGTPIRVQKGGRQLIGNQINWVTDKIYKFVFDGSYLQLEEYNPKSKIVSGNSVNVALSPGVFYQFTGTAITTLNVSSTSNYVNEEISFEFKSGTATVFTYPSTWKWANGTAPTISANKTYHVSVVNNCAVIAEF